MLLYTEQTLGFYEKLQRDGMIYCEVQSDFAKEVKDAYTWMSGQMKQRIGCPDKEGVLPIWAWYQYSSKKRRRPTIDKENQDGPSVLLEIDIPDSEVLLSDYILWHHVLNKYSISSKRAYLERRIAKLEKSVGKMLQFDKLPNDIQEEVKVTWERVFDLDHRDPYYAPHAKRNRAIQATFWCLKIEQVKDVVFF